MEEVEKMVPSPALQQQAQAVAVTVPMAAASMIVSTKKQEPEVPMSVVAQVRDDLEAMDQYLQITKEDKERHAANLFAGALPHVLNSTGDRTEEEAALATLMNTKQVAPPPVERSDDLAPGSLEYIKKYWLSDQTGTAAWKYWVGRTIEKGELQGLTVVYVGEPLIADDGEELRLATICWAKAPEDKTGVPLFDKLRINPVTEKSSTYPTDFIECYFTIPEGPDRPESAIFIPSSSRKAESLNMRADNDLVLASNNRIVAYGGVEIPIIPERFANKKQNGVKATKAFTNALASVRDSLPDEATEAEVKAKLLDARLTAAKESVAKKAKAHAAKMKEINDPNKPHASVMRMFPVLYCRHNKQGMTSNQLFQMFATKHRIDPSLQESDFQAIAGELVSQDERIRILVSEGLCFKDSTDVFRAVVQYLVDAEAPTVIPLEDKYKNNTKIRLETLKANEDHREAAERVTRQLFKASKQAGDIDLARIERIVEAAKNTPFDPREAGVSSASQWTSMILRKFDTVSLSKAFQTSRVKILQDLTRALGKPVILKGLQTGAAEQAIKNKVRLAKRFPTGGKPTMLPREEFKNHMMKLSNPHFGDADDDGEHQQHEALHMTEDGRVVWGILKDIVKDRSATGEILVVPNNNNNNNNQKKTDTAVTTVGKNINLAKPQSSSAAAITTTTTTTTKPSSTMAAAAQKTDKMNGTATAAAADAETKKKIAKEAAHPAKKRDPMAEDEDEALFGKADTDDKKKPPRHRPGTAAQRDHAKENGNGGHEEDDDDDEEDEDYTGDGSGADSDGDKSNDSGDDQDEDDKDEEEEEEDENDKKKKKKGKASTAAAAKAKQEEEEEEEKKKKNNAKNKANKKPAAAMDVDDDNIEFDVTENNNNNNNKKKTSAAPAAPAPATTSPSGANKNKRNAPDSTTGDQEPAKRQKTEGTPATAAAPAKKAAGKSSGGGGGESAAATAAAANTLPISSFFTKADAATIEKLKSECATIKLNLALENDSFAAEKAAVESLTMTLTQKRELMGRMAKTLLDLQGQLNEKEKQLKTAVAAVEAEAAARKSVTTKNTTAGKEPPAPAATTASGKGNSSASAAAKGSKAGASGGGGGAGASDASLANNPIARAALMKTTVKPVPEKDRLWLKEQVKKKLQEVTKQPGTLDTKIDKLRRQCRPTNSNKDPEIAKKALLPDATAVLDKNQEVVKLNRPSSYLLFYDGDVIDLSIFPNHQNIFKLWRDYLNRNLEDQIAKNRLANFTEEATRTVDGKVELDKFLTQMAYLVLKYTELSLSIEKKADASKGGEEVDDDEKKEEQAADPWDDS